MSTRKTLIATSEGNGAPPQPLRQAVRLGLAICLSLLLLIIPCSTALAQGQAAKSGEPSGTTITASASGERVRFTAPTSVAQIRLEVYNSEGKTLSDTEVRGGNVLDWLIQDGQAQRLPDGTYLCVVTVKSLSGKITQRIGSVTIEKTTASVQAVAASEITPQQSEAIGPLEQDAGLTVLKDGEKQTTTVIAHNGDEGQITRGRGALSFRVGDFYGGKDTEQMRLTAEGNLGIGTSNPQARLDVAGSVRASEGITFPDGSVQFSAARKTVGAPSLRAGQSQNAQGEDGGLLPDISGTGTTGRISKWLDGPNGVLNDSNITEEIGAIGINGTPNTNFRLDVNGSTRIRGTNPGFNLEGLRPAGNIWLFQTVDDDGRFRLFGQDNVNPGVERLTINLSTGNVGIGTSTPASLLDVAGSINTSTQYNLAGSRVLSVTGLNNTFAGVGAGAANTGGDNSFFGRFAGNANTTGGSNSFFGRSAGQSNTTGSNNAFFGRSAGAANTTGTENSFFGNLAGTNNSTGENNTFFGANAGVLNTTGNFNAFFGRSAGVANTSGSSNSFFGNLAGNNNSTGGTNAFFGARAGQANTTGSSNAFFGERAGESNTTASGNSFFGNSSGIENTTGVNNSFFGRSAGASNTTANGNSFFGNSAGEANTTGNNNAFFGASAGLANTTGFNNAFFGSSAGDANTIGTRNSFFGRAAGGANTEGFSNSFFGESAGIVNTTGSTNSFFGHSAGAANTTGFVNSFFGAFAGESNITGAGNSFFGRSAGVANTSGFNNSFFGNSAGLANTTGSENLFFGRGAGLLNTTGGSNSFFGETAGGSNTTGSDNTIVGSLADVGSGNLNHATAIGAGAVVSASNTIVLGRSGGQDEVVVQGALFLGTLGAASATHVCINGFTHLSTCSSSLRYKEQIRSFHPGMDLLHRLRPVTFNWKATGEHDLGLIAEEVAEIEPLLITHSKNGEIEGVKYDQLNLVLINAVREQQEIINAQQKRVELHEERFRRHEEIVKNLQQQEQMVENQRQYLAAQQQALARLQHEVETLKKLCAASRPAPARRSTRRN